MAYQWNGAVMWDTVTLPKVIGNYLKLASPLQWQVLLWMATQGRGQGDAAACAAALGARVTEADCADALAFWVQEGILQEDGQPAAPAPTPAPPQPVEQPASPAKPPVVRPHIDVTKLAQADSGFPLLLQETASRLGKVLSPHEMEKLALLMTERDLPVEVILMAVQYAISQNKRSVSYAVRVADSWADEGIFTIEQVNERLCREKQQEEAANRLLTLLDTEDLKLTLANKKMIAVWFYDWSLGDALIRLAYDRSQGKKSVIGYMNRLLESWHAHGLLTPEQVLADEDPHKPKTVTAPSGDGGFDMSKYSAMLENHVPTYKRKEEDA